MTLKNRLGGHTNSYHTYSLEEALEGIAAAGYRYVELSAVRGWTEHVPLEADAKTLGGIQRMMNQLGLVSLSLSGHSDLTTKDGLKDGLLARRPLRADGHRDHEHRHRRPLQRERGRGGLHGQHP